jgi:glycosyltransferase involved in cell wall biosynthesis
MEENFDWEYYVNNYQDLKNAGISTEKAALRHWNKHGREEGRLCMKIPEHFNWVYYITNYPDLNNITSEMIAYEHYINYGQKEGRKCNSKQIIHDIFTEEYLRQLDVRNDVLVSIILPVKNGDKLLKNCVESILNQIYQNIELIIINDGSTDNTDEYCKSLQDNRIIYISQENIGVSNSLNKGMEIAKGEYITWIYHYCMYDNRAIILMKDALDKFKDSNYVYASYKVTGKGQGINIAESILLKDFLINFTGSACFLFRKPTTNIKTQKETINYMFLFNLLYQNMGNIVNIRDILLNYNMQTLEISNNKTVEIEVIKNLLNDIYKDDKEFICKLYPFLDKNSCDPCNDELINLAKIDLIYTIKNQFNLNKEKKQFFLDYFNTKFDKMLSNTLNYNNFKYHVENYKHQYDYSNFVLKTYVINLKKDTNRMEKFKKRFKEFSYEIFNGIDGYEEEKLFNNWRKKFTYNLDFDWKFYTKSQGLDIKSEKEAYEHYHMHGKSELRLINDTCNLVNKGQWGCLQSHLTLIKKVYDENNHLDDYRILILEDDAIPVHNFKENLRNIIANEHLKKMEIIYIGASQHEWDNLVFTNNDNIDFYNGSKTNGTFGYIINKEGIKNVLEFTKDEKFPIDLYLTEFQKTHNTAVIYPNIVKSDLKVISNIQPKSYNIQELEKKFKWK